MGQITKSNFGIAMNPARKFTNSLIQNLPLSSPITMVEGIADRIIMPVFCSFLLSPWVADYTNIDGGSNITLNINGVFTPFTMTGAGLLAQGQAICIWQDLSREYDGTPYDFDDLVGQSLDLVVTNGAAGAFTGGDATTFLTVQVFYNVLSTDGNIVT